MKKLGFSLFILIIFLFSVVSAANIITSSSTEEECEYNWVCSDWTPTFCEKEETQTRKCENFGTCADDYDHPKERRNCSGISEKRFKLTGGLNSSILYKPTPLVSFVVMESLDDEQNFINLTYLILDDSGKTVEKYTEQENLFGKQLISRKFDSSNLSPGDYTFVLLSEIDGKKKEEFRREFVVYHKEVAYLNYFLAFMIVVVLALVIYSARRKKF